MRRFQFLLCALISLGIPRFALGQSMSPQNAPAFQWIKEVDSSGQDSLGGLGVDAAGNTYIAGSTYSLNFPVLNAVQNHSASSGLYLITGPASTVNGPAYTALGLNSASFVAVDPQNANTIYAVSNSALLKSTDGGRTFTKLAVPSSQVLILAIDPANDQILYAGTFDQGLFKSTNGGATWTPSNGALQAVQPGEFEFQSIWIDPNNPNVLLASAIGNLYRSADAGANWQTILSETYVTSVAFNAAVPGQVYMTIGQGGAGVSIDDGQTFTNLATPTGFGVILPDPNHSGRLVASSPGQIYQSSDGGNTWTTAQNLNFIDNDLVFVADWTNGFLYTAGQSVVRITTDLQTVMPVGPATTGYISSIAAKNGIAYVALQGTRDVYVTKLDPSGNIVYSTYYGGSADDVATALTVDKSGNVYVAGTTNSVDFPVTKGAYANSGGSFLFKLNPDGSLGYSTYFTGAIPETVAVDASGSAYMAGTSGGGLPVTPGAYQSSCGCGTFSTGFLTTPRPEGVTNDLTIFTEGGFVAKFDPAGSTLVYATYIGGSEEFSNTVVPAILVAPDGSTYVGGETGIYHLNASGSALLGSLPPVITPSSMALGADGSLYAAGAPNLGTANPFQPTAGAFETTLPRQTSLLPGQGALSAIAIGRWDAQLANLLSATYLAGPYSAYGMALDSSGNVYLGGGSGSQGLATRTPMQLGFAPQTGFVSELSGDLSTLLFSSYFGDTEDFTVEGLAVRDDGSVVLGGMRGRRPVTLNNAGGGPMNIWVNSLTWRPRRLRVSTPWKMPRACSTARSPRAKPSSSKARDSARTRNCRSAASAVPPISALDATSITATVPAEPPAGAAVVQVSSGGAVSNPVRSTVAPTRPASFRKTEAVLARAIF